MKVLQKKSLLINVFYLCVFCLLNNVYTQVNYVQNPSFEELYHCPTYTSIIDSVVNWGHLKTGGGGTPAVYNTCNNALVPMYGIPNNGYEVTSSYQFPFDGTGYSSIFFLWHDTLIAQNFIREYLQNELRTRLTAAKQYCIKIHVSLTNSSTSAIDRIGFYFDDGTVESEGQYGLIADTLDVELFPNGGGYLQDTMNWMVLEGTFTATGDESYMTIGNFHDNENTDYINLAPSINNLFVAMYYIDDVSVIESDLPAWAGNDTIITLGDSVFIGRPPEIGLECTWYDIQGDSIGAGAGIWVSPVVPTAYIVEQVLCGNVKRDTVMIYAYPTEIDFGKEGEIRVYPNPAEEILYIETPLLDLNTNNQLSLIDLQGREILRQGITEEKTAISVRDLLEGLYFIRVETDKRIWNGKWVKKKG